MAALERKYDGPIEDGMVFTAPDNEGVLGYRRIKVIGRDADDGFLIYKEMPSVMRLRAGSVGKIPEQNVRYVFFLEEGPHLQRPGELGPVGSPTYYCDTHGQTIGAHYCVACRAEAAAQAAPVLCVPD